MSDIIKDIINFNLSIKEQNKNIYQNTNFIPIFLSKNSKEKNLPNILRNKYLIEKNLTFKELLNKIIIKLNLNPSQSIYLYVNNKILNINDKISPIYEHYKNNDDFFLYVEYTSMGSFG